MKTKSSISQPQHLMAAMKRKEIENPGLKTLEMMGNMEMDGKHKPPDIDEHMNIILHTLNIIQFNYYFTYSPVVIILLLRSFVMGGTFNFVVGPFNGPQRASPPKWQSPACALSRFSVLDLSRYYTSGRAGTGKHDEICRLLGLPSLVWSLFLSLVQSSVHHLRKSTY